MPAPDPQTSLAILQREASAAAARLQRDLRLPYQERDDIRQDLLADVYARLSLFDEARGSLGAFAGRVMANRAAYLARCIRRHRVLFAPVAIDAPTPGVDGGTLADAVGEADDYLAQPGQPTDSVSAIDRRLDLQRALGTLGRADLEFCTALMTDTPTELSRAGRGAPASIYRQIRNIRLQLLTAGVDVNA
jgi:RNA polymerase sigma-70 factor (ECF subfamily)